MENSTKQPTAEDLDKALDDLAFIMHGSIAKGSQTIVAAMAFDENTPLGFYSLLNCTNIHRLYFISSLIAEIVITDDLPLKEILATLHKGSNVLIKNHEKNQAQKERN